MTIRRKSSRSSAAAEEKRTIFVPLAAWLLLLLFTALLLALSLKGLAASGHFPYEHCSAVLRRGLGRLLLFGSIATALICLLVGITVAWRYLPWYAAVIGGGGAILIAPLALQPLPDRFVDGAGALIVFGGASLVLTAAMTCIVVAGSGQ
jgi:hypothetical protein